MRCSLRLLCVAMMTVWALPTWAKVPANVSVEGRLFAAGGGPISDGSYTLAFRVYDSATAKTPLWEESAKLLVLSGQFSHPLGSVKALSDATLASATWFSVSVQGDPELPRTQLRASAYARLAAVAESANVANGVSCTGCVSVKSLKFDGDVDLGGASLKAKNVIATGDILAGTVTASSFVGDGGKLTGVNIKGGACKSGHVVTGVNPDGTVTCAQGGGGQVLGGKLSDVFTEVAKVSAMPLSIPDNTGAAATALATYGKVGTAMTIEVKIKLANTDLSNVSIKLLPPDDKKTGYTICDPCGAKDAKSYDVTLTEQSTLKAGSLKSSIGKPLDGVWTLQVLDSSFCQYQLQGNAALCDVNKKLDGSVQAFSVSGKVTSSVSVTTPGTFQFGLLTSAPFACEPAKQGHAYFNTKTKKLSFCDGAVWRSLSDSCGNGILEMGEECDDGNNQGGDGCSETCVAGMGSSASDPGASCLTILTACKAKNKTCASGPYWLVSSGTAVQSYCDMTTQGGGWTLVAKVQGNNSTMNRQNKNQWRLKQQLGDCSGLKSENALCATYSSTGFDSVMIRGLDNAARNLGWKHPVSFKSVWHVVDAGKRVSNGSKLFGSVQNLDHDGSASYHNDCSQLEYGFLTADWTYSDVGIAGHNIPVGHSGGVVGASLFDPGGNRYSHNYGPDDGKSTKCLSDFSLGSGYHKVTDGGKNAYAINAHWWGAGNTYTHSWKSHGLFVR